MIGNKSLILNLDELVKIEVKLGTNHLVRVVGKGVVNILAKQGQWKSIANVFYS